jgi:hypothetical protein
VTERAYKFRLSQHRRGGAIRIEMHTESETDPAQYRAVARTREGYHEFVIAADSLLRCVMWDPRVNPTSAGARAMWNERQQDYPLKNDNEVTCLLYLPQLLHPKRGRPLRPELDAARTALGRNTTGGTTVSAVTAHARRRAEILLATSRALVDFEPIRERMTDARRMKGYTAAEVNEMAQLIESIYQAITTLRRKAQANAFLQHNAPILAKTMSDDSASAPAHLQEQLRESGFFVTDDLTDDTALSVGEQSIAIEQAFVEREQARGPEPERCYPGTNFITAEWLRYHGASAEEIALAEAGQRRRESEVPDQTPVAPRGFEITQE